MDDAARFRALYAEAYAPLRRWAHHRGLQGADADDVIAEVFTIAWRRIAEIPTGADVPWLFGVARNVMRNHRRAANRRAALARIVPPTPTVAPPGEPGDATVLLAALDSLHPEDQEVLRLVAWDGLSPSQLPVALGCSAGAARVRLHRARRRFEAAVTELENRTRSQREPCELGVPRCSE